MTNDEIDKKILTAIGKGINTAGKIQDSIGSEMRETDRALQRLKRTGKITFDKQIRAWRLVEAGK